MASVGNVKKMYHQILVDPILDASTQRFLWRNMKPERNPDTYIKLTLTFGTICSPALANIAMELTAEANEREFPEAATTIKFCRYMDDICESVENVTTVQKRTNEIDKVLKAGHFTIKEWESNEPKGQSPSVNTNHTTVLGLNWNKENDTLSIQIKLPKQFEVSREGKWIVPRTLTKRLVLSVVSGVFDVFGFAAQVIIRAKVGLQELWRGGKAAKASDGTKFYQTTISPSGQRYSTTFRK